MKEPSSQERAGEKLNRHWAVETVVLSSISIWYGNKNIYDHLNGAEFHRWSRELPLN